jgi:hypothetical protein
MSGFAGMALRKVMETIRSTYYPADFRGGNAPMSTRRPFTRARIAQPGEIRKPPKPRTIMPAYYEMSQNFKQSKRRFGALLVLALILLVFFVLCIGMGVPFRR